MSLYSRLLALHAHAYDRSGGWVGHRLLGVPTVLLRTTGRKTGLPRTSVLAYAVDDESPDTLLVVASNHGGDRPPAWLLNAVASDEVEVQLKRKKYSAKATAIYPEAPDYDRVFERCDANNHRQYSRYQGRTARPIPVVALKPT